MSETIEAAEGGDFPNPEPVRAVPSFGVGSILRLSFDTWRATFPTAFVACLILGIPQSFSSSWFEGRMLVLTNGLGPSTSPEAMLLYLASTSLALVVSQLMIGWTATASYQALLGRRCSIGESLAAGWRRTVPLLGASAFLAVGFQVGLLMLIVPGIIFACAYALIAPIVVCEGRKWMVALNRSADLTRGRRLPFFVTVFGLGIVLGFPSYILSRLLLNIARALFDSLPWFAPTLIGGIVDSLIASFLSQVPIVAWFLLRQFEEGAEVGSAIDVRGQIAESRAT